MGNASLGRRWCIKYPYENIAYQECTEEEHTNSG